MPPAVEHERPQHALGKAHDHLIAHRDPRHGCPTVGLFNALQIALLEAKVGQRRHRIVPWGGPQHADGNLVFSNIRVGVGVGIGGGGGKTDGLLLGDGRGGIEVMMRRGLPVDGRRL